MNFRLFFLLALLCIACNTTKKPAPVKKTPATTRTTPKSEPELTVLPLSGTDRPDESDIKVRSDAQTVAWLDSEYLMPVLEKAQKEQKIVFVEFSASWCAPCKIMDEEVFSKKRVYEYLNQNFLNFKADCDKATGKAISEIHEVKGLPTILFLSPKGVVLERHLGFANASTIFELGDAALEQMK